MRNSPETRAKISVALRGRTFSPEHRAKISAAQIGRPVSPETRAKISAALKGRRHTEESRAKMSAWRKGRPQSAEHRAKVSVALKGRSISAEHRAKLSAAHLRTGVTDLQRAHEAIASAIRRGDLTRRPCEICGRPPRQRGRNNDVHGHHHLGYSPEHWLDVIWLCRKHHGQAEREARMARRSITPESLIEAITSWAA